MLAPVIVTAVVAKARPTKLAPTPVKLMAVPASTFPTKSELPSNTAVVPSRQYTLHALPPLAMTTEPPMGVMEVPLKIQTPSFFPRPSSVNVLVNFPTSLMQ